MSDIFELINNPIFQRLLYIAIVGVILMTFSFFIKKRVNKSEKFIDNRYKIRKGINLISYLLLLIIVLFVFSDKLGNIGVALSVVGAGIAFAMQEIIVSLAGWINIMFTSCVKVGDRVKIGSITGDIIDIGITSTTLMELGEWVKGDLYNGRIVKISNSFVYKESIHQYSSEYPFLWDELTIPITTTSDYFEAQKLFEKILQDICGNYAIQSENEWEQLSEKYKIEKAQVKPMVSLQFDENWITFTLRYIVDYKKRRSTKTLVYSEVLKQLPLQSNIQIAYSTLEITSIKK